MPQFTPSLSFFLCLACFLSPLLLPSALCVCLSENLQHKPLDCWVTDCLWLFYFNNRLPNSPCLSVPCFCSPSPTPILPFFPFRIFAVFTAGACPMNAATCVWNLDRHRISWGWGKIRHESYWKNQPKIFLVWRLHQVMLCVCFEIGLPYLLNVGLILIPLPSSIVSPHL